MGKRALSIYIHIPFCVRKCLYCDFLSAPATDLQQEQYVKALCCEIRKESTSYVNHEIKTVFLGGGTPSLLLGEQLNRILDTVRKYYDLAKDCEISMEVNPGTVTPAKMSDYRQAGVNRLSIGLQSVQEEELKALGRIHNYREFLDTWQLSWECGFKNLNVDLMFGIPGQTVESWQDTLYKVTALHPAPVHLSAYGLILEENTPFYENTPLLPEEDAERKMYQITGDFLKKKGYHRYEISNYAKDGFECRHNRVYWERGDYAGFGLGAASLVGNVRFRNTENLNNYVNQMRDGQGKIRHEDIQKLSKEEQMEEFMFLGLRLMEGISVGQFARKFGVTVDERYPGIVEKYCKMGLLERRISSDQDVRIALTEPGIDVSNRIMADFLLT